MHKTSTHFTSDSWLVWEVRLAGHPVHLTEHSITVAHKLLQGYKPAWADCRLHMWMHFSSSSSCPHPRLHSLLLLLFPLLAFPQTNAGLLVVWEWVAFWFPPQYFLISPMESDWKMHKQRKRPQTSGLMSFKHPLLTRADKSCSFFSRPHTQMMLACMVCAQMHPCTHADTHKDARHQSKNYTLPPSISACESVKRTHTNTQTPHFSQHTQQGCSQRVFSPSSLLFLFLSRVCRIATDVGSNLFRRRRCVKNIDGILQKGFKNSGVRESREEILRSYRAVVSFR